MNAAPQSRAASSALDSDGESMASLVMSAMTLARRSQERWAGRPMAQRIALVRHLRDLLCQHARQLAEASASARHRPVLESLTAEVVPLLEALRFLEREAESILGLQRFGRRGRPLWLTGVHSEVHREPFGVVLIIGPGNYPLLLPGIQLVQALVAGNGVLLKPGVGGTAAAIALRDLIIRAGFDANLLLLLPESPEAARAAIYAQPDKVLFTGSAATGEHILTLLAPQLIPATMELSGCDAVIVCADADLDLVVKALEFGLHLNNGATCIVPKRVFVARAVATDLESRLAPILNLNDGETLSLITVADEREAVLRSNDCPFALGASVFSRNLSAARQLAGRIHAGVVTINDLIIPTADARLPFGGRKRSGFGVTRGAEGLLELTRPKVVTVSRSRFRPAFQTPRPQDAALFAAYLRLTHGRGLASRSRALVELLRSVFSYAVSGKEWT